MPLSESDWSHLDRAWIKYEANKKASTQMPFSEHVRSNFEDCQVLSFEFSSMREIFVEIEIDGKMKRIQSTLYFPPKKDTKNITLQEIFKNGQA